MSGAQRLEGRVVAPALRMLAEVSTLLEKKSIRYCLDGGTLLGIYREGRLLPWDNDLDFFVRAEDAEKIERLRLRLLFMGYGLSRSFVSEDNIFVPAGSPRIFKIKSLRKFNGNRIVVDLIFKYADESHYHWLIGENPYVHKKVARKHYDALDSLQFAGRQYPIPSDVETYLSARYGDWKTCVRDYDFRNDDGAIVR